MVSVHRPLLILFLCLVAPFALFAMTPVFPRMELLYAMALGISVAVGIRYFSVGWYSLFRKTDHLRPGGMLAVGIAVLWIAEPLLNLWSYLWRLHGQPSWMINSQVVSTLIYMKIIAAGLHILAPPGFSNEDGQRVPPRNKWMLTISCLAGLMVFAAILYIAREPVTWLNWLRPYIEEPDARYGRRLVMTLFDFLTT